jgi:hypothetical protein
MSLEQCFHLSRNETLNENGKKIQICVLCKKKRRYNPLNKTHIITSDKDLWSAWE